MLPRTKSIGRSEAITQRNLRHGEAARGNKTPEYLVWAAMRRRCSDPNHKDYPYYGGRGISVCERWLSGYAAFLADVGRRPSEEHSIDRIDNDGNYEPGNVRWATHATQMTNRRRFKSKTHCKHGHEFTEANTYVWKKDGSRKCLECRRATDRARYEKSIADGIIRSNMKVGI